VPTLSMSSALSITRSANPPRAVYLDFPLGHTAGKAFQTQLNNAIMRDTLAAFETIEVAGGLVELDYQWSADDAWKDRVMRPSGKDKDQGSAEHADDRVERHATPQYQVDADREAFEARGSCPTCVFLDA
jgi:hypothetical protein